MIFKFDFSYGELSTIHDALILYLDKLKDECDSYNYPDLYKESIAYKLYWKFRNIIDELNEE